MSLDGVAALAQALLYEGYLLYPYRGASVKNRHRWMFGSLYPRSFAEAQNENDPWSLQAECLVRGAADSEVEVRVRFLHLAEPPVERHVDVPVRALGRLCAASESLAFAFDADPAAAIHGMAGVGAERVGEGAFRVTVRVGNLTAFTAPADAVPAARRDAALPRAFASTHVVLGVRGGEFVSLVEPPATLREAAAGCRNVGVWPVLVGRPGACDTMLAAPIILEDYPRVAPESPGDFFDATEIDELLTLRVLTLTDGEKAAMRADPRTHALLERTEGLGETERGRLHGAVRTPGPGARVRIVPRPGGDVLDLALAGKTATIVKIEEDYEGRIFVAVTVDDDPGRDLGADGRPGHRFFFRPDELEAMP